MAIIRRELEKTKWETPEKMIRDFIEHYELVLEGQPNQIIYGDLFPYSSPESLFVYRRDESLWLYKNGEYLKVFPYKIGTIVPFFGSPGTTANPNIAYFGNTNARPWAMCDGGTYNGIQTPNLQGRGFIGVDSSDSGATSEANGFMHNAISSVNDLAGCDLCKLKEEHLPVHFHKYPSPQDISAGGTDVMTYTVTINIPGKPPRTDYRQDPYPQTNSAQEKNYVTRFTSSSVGWTGEIGSWGLPTRSTVHNNLPPYIILNWKMYVGY